jgi:two-component system alkaline phosphatase synthesis response regulator PhoP
MEQVIKILLVDDEPDILEFIKYNLEKEGYRIFTAGNGTDAVQLAKRELPDVIILDIMMPDIDGIETCRQVREIPELSNVLIAFLTARAEDYSQIAGFEVGADDYITKPIRPRVLSSRVKALLRRKTQRHSLADNLVIDDLVIDREKYTVKKKGESITLRKKEFELLLLLAEKPGKVFTRDEILDKVWGSEVVVGDRTIDVHINKLREKIGGSYIRTLKGIGYKFEF